MNQKIAIDGIFIGGKRGGQERYALEILRELDKLCKKDEIEIVVPSETKEIPTYENIRIVRFGKLKGIAWEQIDFLRYLIKYHREGLYLINHWPLLRPDYPVIHDCIWFDCPTIYRNMYGRLSRTYHRILFKSAGRRAKKIITVSSFSRQSIVRHLGFSPEKIIVVYNAWQHMERVQEDYSIFNDNKQLIKGEYYLSISSLTPQKNFEWIIKVANRNPNNIFAVIGEKVGLTAKFKDAIPDNMLFLGFISDEKMKAAIKECKAFIHPAVYEGFGITPLEALSQGAKVLMAYSSCLPEIYGDSVIYFDPYEYDVNLDELETCDENQVKATLEKYSWEKSAERLYYRIIK